MASLTYVPDFVSARMEVKPAVLVAQFGDGYAQRVGDGLNKQPEKWSVTFSGRTATERDAILSFFETLRGVTPFDWTSPQGTAGRWVCEEWAGSVDNVATSSITATFVQDFAP